MSLRTGIITSVVIVIASAGILFAMGRVPTCTCGHISLWQGTVASVENSQQISDWYTFSHIIHGILFFWFFVWLVQLWGRKSGRVLSDSATVGTALVLATLLEAGWEILENTPFIINRYREITISWGYTGDSILNSVCDILAMWIGFIFARYVPWWIALLVVIALELFVGYMIRDNLTLNVLMLLYPFEGIRAWQVGG
jgi:hypothetical protein